MSAKCSSALGEYYGHSWCRIKTTLVCERCTTKEKLPMAKNYHVKVPVTCPDCNETRQIRAGSSTGRCRPCASLITQQQRKSKTNVPKQPDDMKEHMVFKKLMSHWPVRRNNNA